MMRTVAKNVFSRMRFIRGNVHRNDRFGGIHRAWGHVFSNHLVGDYVEFGVYHGDGVVASLQNHAEFFAWLSAQKSNPELWRRNVANKSPLNEKPCFHCLDTFAGMPENDEGNLAFGSASFMSDLDRVKCLIERSNRLNCPIEYYVGLFSDTAPDLKKRLGSKKIAIANIDCDLMQSTTDALNAIEDHIDIGTVLLFDDYNAFNANQNKGQRCAFSQFQKKSEFIYEKFYTYHYSGQSFLVIGRQ